MIEARLIKGNSATAYVVFSRKSKWDIQMTESEINFIGINTVDVSHMQVQNISLMVKQNVGIKRDIN